MTVHHKTIQNDPLGLSRTSLDRGDTLSLVRTRGALRNGSLLIVLDDVSEVAAVEIVANALERFWRIRSGTMGFDDCNYALERNRLANDVDRTHAGFMLRAIVKGRHQDDGSAR